MIYAYRRIVKTFDFDLQSETLGESSVEITSRAHEPMRLIEGLEKTRYLLC